MTGPIAVGVIGVGNMGENHARIYSELPDADLIGVADADMSQAADVAARYHTTAQSTEILLERVDAVSIAVPTEHHASVTRRSFDAGVDVLVEKPFVSDRSTGQALVQRAREDGRVLQVGHVERFNPAVNALESLLVDSDILAVTAARLGPPLNHRLRDDVVLDLMIHDLDIVATLVGTQPSAISANMSRDGSYGSALLDFPNDLIATLTASRVTQCKVRQLSVTTTDRYIELDYLDQSVEIHRHARPSYLKDAITDILHREEQVIERPLVNSAEPLKRELHSFLEVIRDRSTPVVTGSDGLRAVAMVDDVKDAVGRKQLEVPEP